MIKYDNENGLFKYYNKNGEHELTNNLTYEEIANIIWDLSLSPEFKCDMSISHALYVATRKMQGFSDEDINKLTD